MFKDFVQKDISRNRQNVINIVASIVNFAVTTLIGFFMSPYIVKHIGVEANGFVSLAHNFTSYAALATAALNSMASRFLMMAYYNDEKKKVEKIYSSVFFANLLLSVIMLVLSAIVVAQLEYILNVPSDIQLGVKVLFATIFLNFNISTAITSWATVPYIKNKLYLTSIANVAGSVIKVGFIVLLFSCFVPSVSYVGVATLMATVVCIFYNYYCKKYLLDVRTRLESFSWSEIWVIISSGVWNSISSLGNIFIHGLDLLLANVFLDATAMGVLAVAKTMPLLVGSLNETIANVFTPSFIIDYAKDNKKNIVHTVNVSAKLISVICTIPLAFLFVFGEDFYSLWQPTMNAKQIFVLSAITIFGRVFFTGMQPLFNIFTVVNKVRQNSVVTIVNGVASLLLTLLCLEYTDYGIYAIAGVSVLCCFFKNMFFVVPFSAKYLGLKWNKFFSTIVPSVLCCILLCLWGCVEKMLLPSDRWFTFCVSALVFVVVGAVMATFVVLNKSERQALVLKLLRK